MLDSRSLGEKKKYAVDMSIINRPANRVSDLQWNQRATSG
jgi:hypothetical protein